MENTKQRLQRLKKMLVEIRETEDIDRALQLEHEIGEALGSLFPAKLTVATFLRILFPQSFFEENDTQLVIDFLDEEVLCKSNDQHLGC